MRKCDRCDSPEVKYTMSIKGEHGVVTANACESCSNYIEKIGWTRKDYVPPTPEPRFQAVGKVNYNIDYAGIAEANKKMNKFWGGA